MLDSHGDLTLIEDGDGVPVVDEGRQLPQAVLRYQGQVVDAYQPTCQICQYVKTMDEGTLKTSIL
jgi:hypothetical protein